MPKKLVTCPETAHLELLTSEDHPLGVLVVDCTRWEHGEQGCPRTCAERLDRRTCEQAARAAEALLRVGDDTRVGLLPAADGGDAADADGGDPAAGEDLDERAVTRER